MTFTLESNRIVMSGTPFLNLPVKLEEADVR